MNPSNAISSVNSLLQRGLRDEAAAVIGRLVAGRSQLENGWLHMAQLALSIGECSLAQAAVNLLLQAGEPQPAEILHCCGILAEANRFDASVALLEPLLKRYSKDPGVNHLAGTLFQQLGQLDRAEECLRQALACRPSLGITWLTLSAQHTFSNDDPLLAALSAAKPQIAPNEPWNYTQYYYALAKAMLDLKEFDRAFDYLEAGAENAPGSKLYDIEVEKRYVNALINNFSVDAFKALNENLMADCSPIFVVGLPRSGTTLLEQILTSHPNVADGGECNGMGLASMPLGSIADLNLARLAHEGDAGQAVLAKVASTYGHLIHEKWKTQGVVVDKSINNVFFLGLIAKAFPRAPLIVVERDLTDVAWSCYRTCFNRGMDWSWSLENIAAHFKTELRLIEHWKNIFGDRIFVLRYEDLIDKTEAILESLLNFCGYEMDQSILQFHRTQRAVTTSSVTQVKKPLNSASIGISQPIRHRMQAFFQIMEKE